MADPTRDHVDDDLEQQLRSRLRAYAGRMPIPYATAAPAMPDRRRTTVALLSVAACLVILIPVVGVIANRLAQSGGQVVVPAGPGPTATQKSTTIVLAIDVSNSMGATDIKPSRLGAVQLAAQQFVSGLPASDQIAVVEFAGTATVLQPPTINRPAVSLAINRLALGPSTAMGEGIYTALGTGGKTRSRIVLIGDGVSDLGRTPAGAAQAARQQNVPIDTIAVGTPHGTIMIGATNQPTSPATGAPTGAPPTATNTPSGKPNTRTTQPVPVEETDLDQVAKITGGHSYHAESAAALATDLDQIVQAVR